MDYSVTRVNGGGSAGGVDISFKKVAAKRKEWCSIKNLLSLEEGDAGQFLPQPGSVQRHLSGARHEQWVWDGHGRVPQGLSCS